GGGGFSYRRIHTPRTSLQSESEARVRSTDRRKAIREGHTAQCGQAVRHGAGKQAHADRPGSGRSVHAFWRAYRRTTHRACAERTNCPSLACGRLESRYLLDCEVRSHRAGLRYENYLGNSGFIVGEKARNRVPFLPVLILSERSSPSRVRFPAPKKRRALDCCGPL